MLNLIQIFNLLPWKFLEEMNSRLAKPFSLENFHFVTSSMAKGKSSSLKEVVVEPYIFFLRPNKKRLIQYDLNTIKVGHLHDGLIRDRSNFCSK